MPEIRNRMRRSQYISKQIIDEEIEETFDLAPAVFETMASTRGLTLPSKTFSEMLPP